MKKQQSYNGSRSRKRYRDYSRLNKPNVCHITRVSRLLPFGGNNGSAVSALSSWLLISGHSAGAKAGEYLLVEDLQEFQREEDYTKASLSTCLYSFLYFARHQRYIERKNIYVHLHLDLLCTENKPENRALLHVAITDLHWSPTSVGFNVKLWSTGVNMSIWTAVWLCSPMRSSLRCSVCSDICLWHPALLFFPWWPLSTTLKLPGGFQVMADGCASLSFQHKGQGWQRTLKMYAYLQHMYCMSTYLSFY